MSYDDVEEAQLYDVQNPWGRSDEFYLRLVRAAGDVLDVGCGTGTLLKRAQRDGHRGRLVGLDPGSGMLTVARAQPGIDWVPGTLAPGAYDREFDLVTMTGHAFQELRTDGAIAATLAGMHSALRPGGQAVFDTRNPATSPWRNWDGAAFEVTYRAAKIRTSYAVLAVDGDLVTFTETLDGGPWHHHVQPATLRFLSRPDLDRFLTAAGLAVETYYGDWDGSPLTDHSPEIITVARRPTTPD
ncbi:MAG TPA: methyltransferase domain-containing protein [Mycobacteriales bacterium]|nr:methyltransferase domain-containing protein [Mycobacteriales bacterium]